MEWDVFKKEFEQKAEEKLTWLHNEFVKIKTGRPNPAIFDSLLVEAYGEKMKIIEVANMQVVDGKQIVIKPYDKSLIHSINSEILKSNLGVTPQPEADLIRISFPPQTEETRKQSVKKAKEFVEQAKIGIRNIRNDIHKKYKSIPDIREDDLKYFDDQLDKITKSYNSKIDDTFAKKEKDLMTI